VWIRNLYFERDSTGLDPFYSNQQFSSAIFNIEFENREALANLELGQSSASIQ